MRSLGRGGGRILQGGPYQAKASGLIPSALEKALQLLSREQSDLVCVCEKVVQTGLGSSVKGRSPERGCCPQPDAGCWESVTSSPLPEGAEGWRKAKHEVDILQTTPPPRAWVGHV